MSALTPDGGEQRLSALTATIGAPLLGGATLLSVAALIAAAAAGPRGLDPIPDWSDLE